MGLEALQTLEHTFQTLPSKPQGPMSAVLFVFSTRATVSLVSSSTQGLFTVVSAFLL